MRLKIRHKRAEMRIQKRHKIRLGRNPIPIIYFLTSRIIKTIIFYSHNKSQIARVPFFMLFLNKNIIYKSSYGQTFLI